MTENTDAYVTDEAEGQNWRLLLGDSCERLAELDDNTIDLSICSPPFDSLYTYSPSTRDLGNSASRIEFLQHYRYIVEHQLRVTKPGRNACIHVQQVATKKAVDLLPRDPRRPGDMKAFDAAIAALAEAARDFDKAARESGKTSSVDRFPSSILGRLREIREKIAKRRVDPTFYSTDFDGVISEYNMMITMSNAFR